MRTMRIFSSSTKQLLIGLAALSVLAGCSGGGSPSAANSTTGGGTAKPGDVKIAFIVKQPEEPWFQREWKFADQAATKDGFTLIKLPAQDGDKVKPAIENAAAQGAQGLVICTPDVKLGPAIVQTCKQDNIKLMTVDDQLVGPDGKFLTDVPHVGISADKIGHSVGDALMAEMKKRGWNAADTGLLVVTYEQLDTARQRTDGAIDAAEKAGFPAAQVFKAPEKTTDVPGSRDAATPILTQHSNLKHWLIASMNDSGVLGAVRATEAFNIPPANVIAIGINGDTGAIDELKKAAPSGLFGTILLQAKIHGYNTSDMMYHWIKDGTQPPPITYTDGILITRDNYKQVLADQGITD